MLAGADTVAILKYISGWWPLNAGVIPSRVPSPPPPPSPPAPPVSSAFTVSNSLNWYSGSTWSARKNTNNAAACASLCLTFSQCGYFTWMGSGVTYDDGNNCILASFGSTVNVSPSVHADDVSGTSEYHNFIHRLSISTIFLRD